MMPTRLSKVVSASPPHCASQASCNIAFTLIGEWEVKEVWGTMPFQARSLSLERAGGGQAEQAFSQPNHRKEAFEQGG